MAKPPCIHLALTLCLTACAAGAVGDGRTLVDRFIAQSWQSEDGLPGNVLRSVAQAADGYLWVATAEGVVRFDGVRFSGFAKEPDATLARMGPRTLFALADGSVWVATTRGGLLKWSNRRLTAIWPEVDSGRSLSQVDLVTQVLPWENNSVLLVRGERVWKMAQAGGSPQPIEKSSAIEAAIREDFDRMLQRGRVMSGASECKLTDALGRVWTAPVRGGLFLSDETGRREAMILGPITERTRIAEMHTDREGNLWVATGESGLVQLRERRVEVLTPTDGLSDRTVFSVLEDRTGTLWAGSARERLDAIAPDGRVTHYQLGEGRVTRPIAALCEDRDGLIWTATRDGSVFRRGEDGQFRPMFPVASGVSKVFAIVSDAKGNVWFGGRNGIAAWNGGNLTRFNESQGAPSRDVTALVVDPAGVLWIGTERGELFRGVVGRFELEGSITSPGLRPISGLLPDGNGGLWITTLGGGLAHLTNGRVLRFGTEEGLPDLRLTSVLDDDAGHLWLGSLGGIIRVSKESLGQVAAGRARNVMWFQLDRSDGMLSRECAGGFQPGGWRGRDGRIWFPTVNGLVMIRPSQFPINAATPPVVIEECRVAGRAADLGQRLIYGGPGRTRLEFRFSALSFVGPRQVRFRIMLEGLETNWSDVVATRSATYEAVPPGRYRFRVIAANGDGIWNEAGAAMAVIITPHFWETTWFRVASVIFAVCTAIGLGWMIARARLRRRMARLEMQTIREKERARIARDLHDDLGASLTEISLLAQLAAEDSHRAEPSREPLPEIAAKADGLVGALDEIVWAVNPKHDTLVSLVDYLAAFAAEFLEAAGTLLRLDIPRELPRLSLDAEQRHSLFLAAREALNNAVKHAQANEIWLRVRLESNRIVLVVQDNGRGFASGAGEFSEGLQNMRERLVRCGGDCRIDSSDGTGTSVTLTLPVPPENWRSSP